MLPYSLKKGAVSLPGLRSLIRHDSYAGGHSWTVLDDAVCFLGRTNDDIQLKQSPSTLNQLFKEKKIFFKPVQKHRQNAITTPNNLVNFSILCESVFVP